ncbi:MAG: DUF2946 family protein [Phycisphaerales bacterium]|nr:DUF2946 family protein [Phycisphaerales bacterium]
MKPNRAILLLITAVLTLHGMGALRTLHNLTHHSSSTLSHACHTTENTQTPSKQAPKSHPSNQPSDQPTDHDCHLCLSLHSLTPTLTEPTQLPLPLPSITQQPTRPHSAVPTLYILSDRPARAPPLS